MKTRALGQSGLAVPLIGMGTWRTFDVSGRDADDRCRLVPAAPAGGAGLFDTSPMYVDDLARGRRANSWPHTIDRYSLMAHRRDLICRLVMI
jgi:aryl-alcohol dehydrogenase-like predicted oxidoreductase